MPEGEHEAPSAYLALAYVGITLRGSTGENPTMPPQTGTALILLVAFALPGFVTVLIQERTYKSAEDPTPLDRLLRVLYYSVWTYLLLAIVALIFGIDRPRIERLYQHNKDNPAELVWRGALAILLPSLAIATSTRAWHGSKLQRQLLRKLRINERHEEPTAWDYFFRQRREAYVRVTLENGARVLGFYGERSFAAYAKDGRDLYLERTYVVDAENDWFGDEVTGNRGVWLRTDDVVGLEFYDPHHDAEEGSKPAAEDRASEEGRPPATGGNGKTA